MRELDEKDVLEVSGGNMFLLAAAGVTVGFALFNAAETAGESIWKAIYYATH